MSFSRSDDAAMPKPETSSLPQEVHLGRSIPRRHRFPSGDPRWWIEQTDDGSRTLVTCRRDDERPDVEAFKDPHAVTYHSGCGARSECEVVYLQHGGVHGPTEQWPQNILEVGLGTCMALLCTLDRYLDSEVPLRYVGLETLPLPIDVIKQIYPRDESHRWKNPKLPDEFLSWYQSQSPQDGESLTWQVDSLRSVEIRIEPVQQWLQNNASLLDTIYFDPFDPVATPDLWQQTLFKSLYQHAHGGTRLVTYCVKSEVRRRLQTARWHVQRVPGPVGGKREVLIATPEGKDSSAPLA